MVQAILSGTNDRLEEYRKACNLFKVDHFLQKWLAKS